MTSLDQIASEWLEAKDAERRAVDYRRLLEDKMLSLIGIPAIFNDGTSYAEAPGGYKIKIVGRIDRKVDAEKLQEVAAESGISSHLASLFRWKAEINMAAWKAADDTITKPLSAAITAKPGRPSFTITKEEQ
jgi:hypothetical protein